MWYSTILVMLGHGAVVSLLYLLVGLVDVQLSGVVTAYFITATAFSVNVHHKIVEALINNREAFLKSLDDALNKEDK